MNCCLFVISDFLNDDGERKENKNDDGGKESNDNYEYTGYADVVIYLNTLWIIKTRRLVSK